MGFLKDLFSDITNYKKPAGIYQSKVIDLVNHLILLSYNELRISRELALKKAEVLLNELAELQNGFDNKFEKFKVYHVDGDVETNVAESLIALRELYSVAQNGLKQIKHSTLLISFGNARNEINKDGGKFGK